MLWVAHSEELINQAEERMQQLNPSSVVEVEQDGRHAPPQADIVIASISRIHQSKRLERPEPDSFRILGFDECHHDMAKMWLNLLHRFKLGPEVSSIPGRAFTGREFRDTAGAYLRTFQPDPSAPYFMGFTAPSPTRPSGDSPQAAGSRGSNPSLSYSSSSSSGSS